ncbi:MAG: protein-disulfide reductase DsbD family protein [Inquilinaceae bacterium]
MTATFGRYAASLWRGLAAALAVLAAGGAAIPAHAAAGPSQDAEFVEGRLIAAVDAVGDLEGIPAGLDLVLAEGWKTYWRSPGDAGLPPTVDWSGSTNVADVAWHWPAPERFTLFGIETFGYSHQVVFPLTVTPERAGDPVALRGQASVLVCSDICVPATMTLALDLPAGPAVPDGVAANLIDRFEASVPDDGVASGLSLERVGVSGPDLLVVNATAREPFVAPDLFAEAPYGFAFGPPEVDLSDGGRRALIRLPLVQAPSESATLDGAVVTATLVDGGRAAERTFTVGAAAPGGSGATLSLAAILGLAVLGGFILNLMPCVLPVLSLKLVSVAGSGGRTPAEVRWGFLASAAGIVASFLVLAAAAAAVKAAGGAVGWGIQFQQPLFLIFMIVLLTLFACNLLGLFEVTLPGGLADRAGQAGGKGLGGHFATGAFATLLATPCSAPFLGTAVGFALARGTGEIVMVFAALGIGMALPYLAVAAWPRTAARLPRPGAWMVWLKRTLSLALIATAVWLLAVLAVQVSVLGAYTVAALMVLLGLLLWGRRALDGRARFASSAVAALIAFGAFLAPAQFGDGARSVSASTTDWMAFERTEIDRLVAAGQTVFVDVTADWCITCQANKALVLNREEIADRFGDGGVVPMRADWTAPDPAIASFLAEHGRYGIPFNIVFGPSAPAGIALPELLTRGAVLSALAEADGRG